MRTTLLIAKPFDASIQFQIAGLPGVVACEPVPGGLFFNAVGGERQVYLSDAGYTTEPDDVPANQLFEGRLNPAYDWTVKLFEGTEPTGEARTAFGEIVIRNDDGDFDYLVDMPMDGRDIELLYGERDDAYDDFQTALIGTVDQVEWNTQAITLRLRDPGEAFRLPIRRGRYGGGGDEDGDVDLTGLPRPLVYGRVRNVTPVLVDSVALLYQVHDGEVEDIDAVRDRGVALVDAGDYATVALLLAATTGLGQDIEPGEFATCLAEGYFRLGGQPDGIVTADVEGDADGSYVDDTANIIHRIATTRLNPFNLQSTQIDSAAFTALSAAQPATVGIYVDTAEISAGEIARRLMAGIGGYWYFNRVNQLVVDRLELPSSPVLTLTSADILSMHRQRVPSPVWRRSVTWRKSWTVQSAEELAASVSEADRQLYGNPARLAVSEDSQARSRHRFARDVVTDAYFDEQTDAADESSRLEEIHHSQKDRYAIELRDKVFDIYVGQDVTVEYPRYGFDVGKDMVIVGLQERNNISIIEVWG